MQYQKKFRVETSRAQFYDYGESGLYFITICTREKQHFFGNVYNGKMELSVIGKLAENYWKEIPDHFPFVNLDDYIVMPNHVHGILEIDKMKQCAGDAINRVSTGGGGITGLKNPMGKGNLSEIIRWFKGRTSFEARKINAEFGWQTRFHDHVITTEEAFQMIQQYIITNPEKWSRDRFYKNSTA